MLFVLENLSCFFVVIFGMTWNLLFSQPKDHFLFPCQRNRLEFTMVLLQIFLKNYFFTRNNLFISCVVILIIYDHYLATCLGSSLITNQDMLFYQGGCGRLITKYDPHFFRL